MQHLDEGTIHAWLDGALDAVESSRIERHVAECATCSEAVAEARGMIAGASRIVSSLDVVPGNVLPQSSGRATPRGWLWRSLRLTPGRAALAATLMLAVGTMLTVQHAPSGTSAPAGVTEANRRVEAAAPAIAPQTPAAPVVAPQTAAAEQTAPAPMSASRSITRDANARAENTPPNRDSAATQPAEARALALTTSGFAAPAAAPPPSAAAQTKVAERSKPVVTQSEIVATTSGAAGGRDSANADSLRRLRANALDSIRSAVARATQARQLSAVQDGRGAGAAGRAFAGNALQVNEATGCYRMNSDSAAVGQTGAFLPRQFLLQQTGGSPPQNVVRAVLPDGRIDSAIAGARWERVTPTTATLYLTRAGGESAPALTLHFADGRVAGQLATPAGVRNIDVVRWSCRP